MLKKTLFWLLLLGGTSFIVWQKWGQSLAFIFFASRKPIVKSAKPASRPFTTSGRPIPTRVHKGSPSAVQAKSRRIVTKVHSK